MKRHYLVGYDISDPKRLAKVAKTVTGFGSRVQYSFFHCFLSNRQKNKLKSLLNKIIREGEDQIILLPVTEKQLKEMEFLGFKINLEAEGIIIV
jgi:CRISPR-associated protein Cas2